MKILFAGVLVIALATTVWFTWPDSSTDVNAKDPESGTTISSPDAGDTGDVTPKQVTVPEPKVEEAAKPTAIERSSKPRKDAMVFPDGLTLPTLNGVTGKVKTTWPPGLPYRKVIEKQTMPNGTDWYLHEGGVWTTTFYSVITRDGQRYRVAVGRTLLERPDLAPMKKN